MLEKHDLTNEQNLKKRELELMEQMNSSELPNQEKLAEVLKKKNLLFYQDLKNKRISKIKSKLYHKIKKKQKQKLQQKIVEENGQVAFIEQEIEGIRRKRAEERISQRHQTKSKNMRNLLKYADKKSVQMTMNEVNQQRREILQKVYELEEK